MRSNIKDNTAKILLIGDSRVGKSSVLSKYIDDKFYPNTMTTIGMDYKVKKIQIDDTVVKLQLWDTAGQERFRAITYSYFKDAHGVFVVFDLSDKQSFQNVEGWIRLMQQFEAGSVLKVLIGNKCDLERDVPKEDVQKICAEFKLPYYEVSAKTGQNIVEPFEFMARLVKKGYLDKLKDSIINMKDSVHPGAPLVRESAIIRLQDKKEEVESKKCC